MFKVGDKVRRKSAFLYGSNFEAGEICTITEIISFDSSHNVFEFLLEGKGTVHWLATRFELASTTISVNPFKVGDYCWQEGYHVEDGGELFIVKKVIMDKLFIHRVNKYTYKDEGPVTYFNASGFHLYIVKPVRASELPTTNMTLKQVLDRYCDLQDKGLLIEED